MIPWIRKNYNISGIDPHQPSVKLGVRKYRLNIKRAFGEKLPNKNDSLDLVISLGSLEHSYDLNKTMKELSRTLKKNAYLFIRWRSDKLIGSPLEYYNHNHYRFFYKDTWSILLKKYGFSNILHLNEKFEGYESYSYIIAKNNKIFNHEIKKNNNYLNQISKQNKYNVKYFKNCLKIEKVLIKKNKFAYKDKMNYLKKNKINLLNIGKYKSVNRYFSECLSFLNFLRKHNYINENR